LSNLPPGDISKQSKTALIFIWAAGAVAFLLLAFSFFSKSNEWTAPPIAGNYPGKMAPAINDTIGKTKYRNNDPENEAFVFVKVNRKYFLTKFTAYLPNTGPGNSLPGENKKELVSKPSVQYTSVQIKRKYLAPRQKTVDFEIKPVPDN
jgi:hypothetical protein